MRNQPSVTEQTDKLQDYKSQRANPEVKRKIMIQTFPT